MTKRIIVTGGTGFIGKKLCQALVDAEYDIIVLTRSVEKSQKVFGSLVTPVSWDGRSSVGWHQYVDQAYAIINLAGENIGAGRWTQKRKQKILESRLNAGNAVIEAISKVEKKPKVLLQASGIGIYGNRGDEVLDELSSKGSGYMPDLAHQWEQSVRAIESMGVRVVYLRTGIVIGKSGGFLRRVLHPFRFFVGGHFGNGKQWISWIHLDDEVSSMKFLLEQDDLSGVVNLTAPNPLTYKDFFKTLGKVMKRPSWFHVPGFLLKTVLGEMADELILSGQRAIPKKLLQAGFEFDYPELKSALTEILRKNFN